MDWRSLLPTAAAALFVLFLLWKMRPAGLGRRPPLDPRIAELRLRSTNLVGAEKSAALCEAGALAHSAMRPTAAFGYYLRAARAEPSAIEPVRGMALALARRRRSLERALWRHLAWLDWSTSPGAARATLEELATVYRRGRDRARVEALGKAAALLPSNASETGAKPAPSTDSTE